MAQVKTLSKNSPSCFIGNDASLNELFSLEITEGNSPKSDFSIYSLLQNNVEKDEIKTEESVMSLGVLAKNHLEKDKTLNDWCFDGDFSFDDIGLDSVSSKFDNSDVKSLDMLSKTHLKDDKTLNEWCWGGDFNLTETVLDAELFPDIDLSLCIKNIKEDKFSDTSNPESVDSGFDEREFSTESTSTLYNKTTLNTNGCFFNKVKLPSCKKSLLFRAISAKPKIDCQTQETLQKIRRKFFEKTLPRTITEEIASPC